MPKNFLQGASLTPTFEALIVKFGGKIGTLYQMLNNAFKKHPLQNRTNVQIKGGGGPKAFWTMFKKTAFFLRVGFPYQHHIDNNVFFIIIIRDVRRFTAMCWLSPTLSLASHLPDCLGISYFVFQIMFTLFLSVLKFHIILYCLFFCKALSVFLHRRLDELPCRRLLAFHPLHRKVFQLLNFFSTTGKTCLLLRSRRS